LGYWGDDAFLIMDRITPIPTNLLPRGKEMDKAEFILLFLDEHT
jgi:hypothetical protein